MDRKSVVYISGPITGVPNYWEPFEKAMDELEAHGCIPLTPTRLPAGMSNEQYMIIDFASINAADAVLFLPGWENSRGATLERAYCDYIGKSIIDCENTYKFIFDDNTQGSI